MLKVLPATCENNQVTVEEQEVEATILSQGTAESEGILLMQGEQKHYIPNTQDDLKSVIQAITDILTNVITVLSSHDGALGGSQSATITLITNANTELTQLKDNLK